MSNYTPHLSVTLPQPPFATDCYPSFRELISWLQTPFVARVNTGVSGQGVDFVYAGNTPPPAGFTGIWARTGASGKPDAIYILYNGQWVIIAGNEIGDVMWKIAKNPQQPPWFKADGTNGTVNLSSLPNYNPAPNLFLHQYVGY